MRAVTKQRFAIGVIRTAAVFMAMGALAHLAYATRFRYGQYSWKPAGGNAIEFTIQNAFRRDGYGCINPATLTAVPCTGPGGLAGVGDVFVETIGGTVFSPAMAAQP